VIARASREPGSLVIGVDAAAAAMAEASRRADRARMTNALFLAAGAASLGASPLTGRADLVTVAFPWGSLLRAVVGLDASTLRGVAAVLRPGGGLEVLASVVPADGVAGLPTLTLAAEAAIGDAWAAAGLRLESMAPASPAQVAGSGSTWARRLLAGRGDSPTARPIWRLIGDRPESVAGLEVEQGALARQPAPVAGERPVPSHDPMTGHEDGQAVGAVGVREGTDRGRSPDAGRALPVRPRRARGDGA
jgi:16S rRNA (adenine(1408)-N(1))-methyltransferase